MVDFNIVLSDVTVMAIIVAMAVYLKGERELYEGHRAFSFAVLLASSFLTLALCMAVDLLILGFYSLPRPAAIGLYSLHYLSTQVLACIYMVYMVRDGSLAEPHSQAPRVARRLAAAYIVLSAFLLAVNAFTGFMFTYEDEGRHISFSPAFILWFLIILATALTLVLILLRQRRSLMPQFRRTLSYLVPFMLLDIVLQSFFPLLQLMAPLIMVCLFFSFMELTSMSFLVDSRCGCGNVNMLTSSLGYHFSKDVRFSVISVEVTDWPRLVRDTDIAVLEEAMCALANRMKDLDDVLQVFRMADNRFALIGPDVASPACRQLCIALTRLAEGFHAGEPGGQVHIQAMLLPCPVVAGSVGEVHAMLSFFSAAKFDFALESHAWYSTHNGSFSLVVCDLKLKDAMNRKRHIVELLKEASTRGLFELDWQPVFDRDGRFAGFAEGLVRLYDRRHGRYVQPDEFIPVAETEGFIDEITDAVLGRGAALTALCRSRNIEPPVLSINLSSRQFYNPSLEERLLSSGIEPHKLRIELTEGSLIEDFQTAKEVMARLSAKGIGFALDDFGSGYAGLSRYMALSFDCVKIDRSLLEAAMSSGRNDVLLRSLASCFTSLGMLVVLEGVEDEDCFSYASSFPEGVLIQGYRCASPMDQDSFISFLEENAR